MFIYSEKVAAIYNAAYTPLEVPPEDKYCSVDVSLDHNPYKDLFPKLPAVPYVPFVRYVLLLFFQVFRSDFYFLLKPTFINIKHFIMICFNKFQLL